MSSIREITALRHQGNLKEAYLMAKDLLQEEPGEWANMAMFWVLRDMALQFIAQSTDQSKAQAYMCLDQMEKLQLDMIDDSDAGVIAIMKIKKALVPHYEELKQYVALSKTNPGEAYEQAIAISGKQAENLDVILHEDFGWILYRYFKSRLNELTSIEVRRLLRDYIMLKNERPSMLHSMILNFALNFAKNHSDFIFPNFLKLWGISNLRTEDLRDGHNNGATIPSLISRICAQLAMTDTPLIEEVSQEKGLPVKTVVDMHRKQWFWLLFELQKTNAMEEFWRKIDSYTNKYGTYAATKWHSEILKLATRKVDAMSVQPFLNMMLHCKKAGFCVEDWSFETGKDGNVYPPFAVQFAKKCYELIKSQYLLRNNTDLLEALVSIYDLIEKRNAGDEWTARQRAILSIWMNDKRDAIERYRNLLKTMGDKFYIWQEMSQCIKEDSLRIGFLLRALDLEKTEDLIGPLRLQTAEALFELGFIAEAKQFLDIYAAHRKKQGKPCSDSWKVLEENIKQCNMEDKGTFDKKKAIDEAMDYAYADLPWQEYVLNDRFVVNDKPRVSFTNGTLLFSGSPKRLGITKQVEVGTIVRIRCIMEDTSVTPLMLQLTNLPKWSILPEEFAYVVHINEAKSAVSIITPQSEEAFFFDHKKVFKAADFISFRYYTRKRKEETIMEVVNPQLCARETAIHHFKQRVVAVDGVNRQKALFHIVMGAGLVSDIVKFKDTELRPAIGDLLKIIYCIRKNKEGKKRIVILDLQTTDETNEKLVKSIEGWLELKYKSQYQVADFGFVCDTYVPSQVLLNEGVENDCRVRARAVISDNGKWKVFKLERI